MIQHSFVAAVVAAGVMGAALTVPAQAVDFHSLVTGPLSALDTGSASEPEGEEPEQSKPSEGEQQDEYDD